MKKLKLNFKKIFLLEWSPFKLRLREFIIHFKFRIKNLFKYKTLDFFYLVGIETITICNRKCAHCPNSLYPKEKKLMEPEIFKKIINDLAAIDYSGNVSPYFYGEPLLDERMPEFIEYASKKLPKASLYIHTNGDYLTKELFLKLKEKGVKNFLVTQHENKPPKKFLEWYSSAPSSMKKNIIFKELNENSKLSNRGGLVKVKKRATVENMLYRHCPWARLGLFIDVNGNMLLCCNDFFGNHSFGNVKEKTIIEIWNGEKYKKLRSEINKGKFNLEICKKCVF